MTFLKLLIPLISIGILYFPFILIKIYNLKTDDAWKQSRFLWISLLFFIICCIYLSKLRELIDWVMSLSIVQNIFINLIPSEMLSYAIILFSVILINAIVFFAFSFIKLICKIRIKKIKIPSDFNETITKSGLKKWYWIFLNLVYDIEDEKLYLRQNWVKVKWTLNYFIKIISCLYLIAIVLFEIPLLYSFNWYPYDIALEMLDIIYLFPAITIIVIAELKYFLSGYEQTVNIVQYDYESSNILIKSNLEELINEYKKYFSSRFVKHIHVSTKSDNYIQNDIATTSDVIEQIKKQINKNGLTLNPAYIKHIETIQKGKDIIIDASLYNEFGEYLYRYLNVILSRGETVLFIDTNDENINSLLDLSKKRFKSINSYHEVWKMNIVLDILEDNDVLFALPDFIDKENIFNVSQKSFFERLSTVIIINSTEIVSLQPLALSLLNFKISNIVNKRKSKARGIQYICLSENLPLGINNALKTALQLKDITQGNTFGEYCNTHIMLWQQEDKDGISWAQDALFGKNISSYWGVDFPIAQVAVKHGIISPISIISQKSTPYHNIINSIKLEQNKTNKFFGDNKYIDFDKCFLFNNYYNDDHYTRFLIVNDELNNLPSLIYNLKQFGGNDISMVHIISKPYMLRDYFYDHTDSYLSGRNPITIFMPYPIDSIKLKVFKLLYELQKSALMENEIINRVKEITTDVNDYKNINTALAFCVKSVTGKDNIDPIYNYFSFQKKSVFQNETLKFKNVWVIKFSRNLSELFPSIGKSAVFDISGEKHIIPILSNGISQNYIKDQLIINHGKIYKINTIDLQNGVVDLTDGPNNLKIPSGYVQSRIYIGDFKKMQIIDEIHQLLTSVSNKNAIIDSYELKYMNLPMIVKTNGYYTIDVTGKQIDFSKENPYTILNEIAQNKVIRDYENASVLSLKLNCKMTGYTDKVSFLLAVMLNELFKTWLPYLHNYVAVCAGLKNPNTIFQDKLGVHISKYYPQVDYVNEDDSIKIFIIEDSESDLGIVQYLYKNRYDVLTQMFNVLREYLNWHINLDETSNKYLYFGSDIKPDIFDFEMLYKIVDELSDDFRTDAVKSDESSVTSKGNCSFCGTDIVTVEYKQFEDGRLMCDKCSGLIINDKTKLKKLYNQAIDYLHKEFNVVISSDIKVKFTNAEAIRLRMQTGEERLVLGFASYEDRELWVESDAPMVNLSEVIVHELTHFWQFDNLDYENADYEYIEGHASYVEIQYLRYLNQKSWAKHIESSLNKRDDSYGRGYRKLKQELQDRQETNSFTYMKKLFG